MQEKADTLSASHESLAERLSVERHVQSIMQLSDDAVHLLANDTDWVWESDEAHIIRYLSDGYSQVTGADPAEAVGRTRLDKLLDNAGSRSSTA